jgi:regulator of protease activity HflC (stomatin/prohibitin superfamily)
MVDEAYTDTADPGEVQLTQLRVPLAQAADAFAQKDATGRTPIILVPDRVSRVNAPLVIGGGALILFGLLLSYLLAQAVWGAVAVPAGLVLLVFGILASFRVYMPEGVNALLARGGKYAKVIGAGMHIVPPWFVITHLVTRREIPYDVPVVEALTSDKVRARVDALITFGITDPYRFVYSISAADFDQVLHAACQEAVRAKLATVASDALIGLTSSEMGEVLSMISGSVERYGVSVTKVTVTDARPPEEFLRSQEERQLAVFHRAEQAEKQALAQRRQADAEALQRQEVLARIEREREALQLQIQQAQLRRQLVEIDAETEDLRLAKLQERLQKYHEAAEWDWQSDQLAVARALAGNSRAVLQVGNAGDIASTFMMREVMRDTREEGAALDPGQQAG